MPDIKGLPVERYKMTDEQIQHLKKVQKFQSIRRALEEMTLKEQAKFKSIQQMWMAMNKGLQLLANEAPKEMSKEIPGMDFAGPEGLVPAGPQELEEAQKETQANPQGSMINY